MNTSKTKLLIIGLIIILISIITLYYYYKAPSLQKQREIVHISGEDKFGIKEIYATKQNGREWFIDMDDPLSDKTFTISSHIPIIPTSDDKGGSWYINNSEVRMNVNTPNDEQQWKNVEMTGYFKVRSITNNSEGDDEETGNSGEPITPDLDFRARGGIHSSESPCEGTALNGGLDVTDGMASWKKEIWHTGGYTDSRGDTIATDKTLLDRWIGWKTVMYNTDDNKHVKMESYIDDNNNNTWKKVTDLTDSGGWYANSSNKEFDSAGCGKSKDYIITNGGPIATFRSDNISFEFKDLSVREIQP